MKDIAPELLEAVQTEFSRLYDESSKVKKLFKSVEEGTATYKQANEYAIEVGEILAKAFDTLSADLLPDNHMYYNIADRVIREPLTNNHKLVSTACAEVQTLLNKQNGLGLKGIAPDLNEELVKSMIDKIVSVEDFDDVKYMLGEPVVNFTQSIVDDTIQTNADFQYKSGLTPKIRRTSTGHCCEWCNSIAGTYEYPDVPKDVYRRHNYCKCIVEYIEGSKKENVHTKKDTTKATRKQQIEDLEALDKRKLEEIRKKRKR